MADRYWVGGTGTWDSSTTTHWSDSSGGTGGKSVPASGDTVYIDSNSGTGGWTVTAGVDIEVTSFNHTDGTFDANDHNLKATSFSFFSFTDNVPTVVMGSGTWECVLWMLSEGDGEVVTITPETSTIKCKPIELTEAGIISNGKTYNNVWMDADGYAVFVTGSSTFNDFRITAGSSVLFGSSTTQTVSTFTAVGDVSNVITMDVLEEVGPVSTGSITDGGTGYSVNDVLTLDGGNGDATVTVTGVTLGVIDSLTLTTPGTGYKVGEFYTLIGEGNEDAVYEVTALANVAQFSLSKSGGVVSCDYLDLSNSNATGGATWYAGSHSVDTSNNDGWTFTDVPGGSTKFFQFI